MLLLRTSGAPPDSLPGADLRGGAPGQAPSHQAERRPLPPAAYLSCRWHSQACARRAEGLAAGQCHPAGAAPFWKDMSTMRQSSQEGQLPVWMAHRPDAGQAEGRLGFHTRVSVNIERKAQYGQASAGQRGGLLRGPRGSALPLQDPGTPRCSWAPATRRRRAESSALCHVGSGVPQAWGEPGRATFRGPTPGPLGWRRNRRDGN